MALTDISIEDHYEGLGWSITKSFVLPVLKASVKYDRLTSYFTVESFLACAEGVDEIWSKRGKMRLLLGIHSIPRELLLASIESQTIDELIGLAKANLIAGCKKLTDEIDRNKIGALAMMIREGFLEVKVGAPRDIYGDGNGGIMHSKRCIFIDEFYNTVVAVGSPNETYSALSKNYEELVVDTSWDRPAKVKKLTDSFQKLWDNLRDDLEVRSLDSDFADELLKAIQVDKTPNTTTDPNSIMRKLFSFIRASHEFAFVNVARAALFPHQERALRDATSRWPIRVLLADEVGLGKTIEAGSVIAYSKRFLNAKRILILTPAGLRRQWQSELMTHFGISSWIYESDQRVYRDINGNERKVDKKKPLDDAPDCIIISWQLARTTWMKSDVFGKAGWKPDIVLVDEAHSARRKRTLDQSFETTLVWDLVKTIGDTCPHLVLLTATPMQMQIEEYHGLLMLLGMPEWWMDVDNFIGFLSVLDELRNTNELSETKFIAVAVSKALPIFKASYLKNNDVTDETLAILTKPEITVQDVIKLRSKGEVLKGFGISYTPPSALTVRNTKAGLTSIGYKFPKREFSAPVLDIDINVTRFLRRIDSYLNDVYGKLEGALGLTKGGANAFTKSIYYQRLVSTLNSANKTLERRADKLRHFIETGVLEGYEPDQDWDDDDFYESTSEMIVVKQNIEKAKQEAAIEVQFIDEMLLDISSAHLQGKDAKLNALNLILKEKLDAGDSVLIFSRFTDTVDACIESTQDYLNYSAIGYGCYTGQNVWINTDGERKDADKTLICDALKMHDIRVVFCSDAASEGLNLQTARCIINIDVPWNPARLEQRIGRIARLGQKAKVVEIHNLWFPSSIESQMYTKLLDRQELYSLAVGEFPDVVGDVIRSRLRTDGDFDFSDIENSLKSLREKAEFSALQRIWAPTGSDKSLGVQFRETLYNILKSTAQKSADMIHETHAGFCFELEGRTYRVEIEAGNKDSLSLYHPALVILERALIDVSLVADIYVLTQSEIPICLLIRSEGRYSMLNPIETLNLIGAISAGESDLPRGHGFLNDRSDSSEILAMLRKVFPNRTETDELKIPWSGITTSRPISGSYKITALSLWG